MTQIGHALDNGICVAAWTFDELYGRDGKFLDGIASLGQIFVGEIPSNFRGWVRPPEVLRPKPRKQGKTKGKRRRSRLKPRVAARYRRSQARHLLKYSPVFRQQSWQRYRIKDTDKGPKVWEIKWSEFWRKGGSGLPTRRHCLIVARNVLTGEVKYFLANRVPGEWNPFSGQYITLRWLLRVAFGRWSIESCFRQSKEELGMDHYEVRGWRCLHRHFYLTQLTHLFCARIRQQYDQASDNGADRLTVEQVRSAVNAWLECVDLCRSCRQKRYEKELEDQQYDQARNEQARVSHTKTRVEQLAALGIDVDRIKSCLPKPPRYEPPHT